MLNMWSEYAIQSVDSVNFNMSSKDFCWNLKKKKKKKSTDYCFFFGLESNKIDAISATLRGNTTHLIRDDVNYFNPKLYRFNFQLN